MKVCTDATLFGAMAPVRGGERVLDIGTGTGLLALMAAQLGAASVHAVEIDAAAAQEAAGNFSRSPWAGRLQLMRGDVRDPHTHAGGRFDLVISNPPFFAEQTQSGDLQRRRARHADERFLAELIQVAARLLAEHGLFYLLLPCERLPGLHGAAAAAGLFPVCQTQIRAFADQSSKISAVTFSCTPGPLIERALTVYDAPRQYGAQSALYLGDFLLRFAATGGD